MTRLNPGDKQKEACNLIGCGYDQLMKMVRSGELAGTYYKIGRRILFVKERLELWQENKIKQATGEDIGCLKIAR